MTTNRRKTGQTEWEARQREREQRWRKHLEAWQRSAWSQAAYCRRHGLTPADFSWWKHELARRDQAAQSAPATTAACTPFVPVAITADSATLPDMVCEVVLRNGRRLRVGRDCPPDWLAAAATALETPRPC